MSFALFCGGFGLEILYPIQVLYSVHVLLFLSLLCEAAASRHLYGVHAGSVARMCLR